MRELRSSKRAADTPAAVADEAPPAKKAAVDDKQADSTDGSEQDDDGSAPDGYVAVNKVPTELWSKAALKRADELLEFAEKCDPDAHDMYVYNDYFGYACVHILEEALIKLDGIFNEHGASSKEAFIELEALTLVTADLGSICMGVDDGDCVTSLMATFAAAWHTCVLALQTEGKLNTNCILNISNIFMSVESLFRDMNNVGGEITRAGDLVSVMLARSGIPWSYKKDLTRHKADEGTFKPKKKYALAALAELSHEEAEQANCGKAKQKPKPCQMDFKKLLRSHKTNYCMPERMVGRGFDITAWPKSIQEKYALDI